jgi:hypothetical protein
MGIHGMWKSTTAALQDLAEGRGHLQASSCGDIMRVPFSLKIRMILGFWFWKQDLSNGHWCFVMAEKEGVWGITNKVFFDPL